MYKNYQFHHLLFRFIFSCCFLNQVSGVPKLRTEKKNIIWTCMDVENFRFFHFEIVYGKVDDVQCFGCGIKYFNQGLLYELWPNDENSIIGRLFFHHPADNLCRECPESNIFDFPELKPISLLSLDKITGKIFIGKCPKF